MSKLTYWLRKLGILRTSSYKATSADELNEMQATDGGMIQSQKEIDDKYGEKKDEQQPTDSMQK